MNHELQELIDAGKVIFFGDRLARYEGNDLTLLAECDECFAPILESMSATESQCVECAMAEGLDTE